MRILVIGKFPPIEGGVSAQTYWMVRALSSLGHTVHVVTNSGDVEPTFRLHLSPCDRQWLDGNAASSAFHVHQTTPLHHGSYIPFAQPYVSQLFGLSLSVVENHKIDVIVSWYFEPYGITASLVGNATGTPVVIRHAGSDLGRLTNHTELGCAYRWAVKNATALIVTHEREFKDQLGEIETRRIQPVRPRLPDVFHSPQKPLKLAELLTASEQWFHDTALPGELVAAIQRCNAKSLPDDCFTIGAYGKVGTTKGSFDLIHALTKLATEREDFAFFAMGCGRRAVLQRYYEAIVSCDALAQRTWILPPIAPWRIPNFLRCCHAVCFLERDFPIAFHGPLIPFEVLSSGACLVCSNEIASKPIFHGNLVDGRNVVIVPNPKDRDALADRLVSVVQDRNRTFSIGRQGQLLARFFDEELHSFEGATETLADELASLVGPRDQPQSKA